MAVVGFGVGPFLSSPVAAGGGGGAAPAPAAVLAVLAVNVLWVDDWLSKVDSKLDLFDRIMGVCEDIRRTGGARTPTK